MPYYEEPPYSPVSTPDLFEKYPFVLTTGARSWSYFHSEQRHSKRLRDLDPWPTVEMNPADAKRLGLTDGDWVYLTNMFGKCRQKVRVTPRVHLHRGPRIQIAQTLDVDVYKRQVQNAAGHAERDERRRHGVGRISAKRHPPPVSYTHLDVYKRQVFGHRMST